MPESKSKDTLPVKDDQLTTPGVAVVLLDQYGFALTKHRPQGEATLETWETTTGAQAVVRLWTDRQEQEVDVGYGAETVRLPTKARRRMRVQVLEGPHRAEEPFGLGAGYHEVGEQTVGHLRARLQRAVEYAIRRGSIDPSPPR